MGGEYNFQQMVLGQLAIFLQKMNLDLYHMSYTTFNSKDSETEM